MPDLESLNRSKERILSTIRLRGPILPVQVAREIQVSPIFAAAFLSELKAEDKIKISNMRVGSSPLYFIAGQEELLEKFVQYLGGREKEAFNLLKQERVLEDEKQTPVVRVALRAIKDFAVPVKARVGGEAKLFWKYFALSDDEVSQIIKKGSSGVRVPPVRPMKKEAEVKEETRPSALQEKIIKPIIKKPKAVETEFSKNVKDYLSGRDVELIEIVSEKKREFIARIRTDSLFGKQEYYLVAKDKKNVSDNDLTIAWQKAHGRKLPALVMCTGELGKKAKEHLSSWGNLVKWERLKF